MTPVPLGPTNRVFLADFGLAKSASTGSDLTRTGQALGTPAYMSPEQARGEVSGLDPATDVWSLGCALYEMLAGRSPFEGATTAETIGRVLLSEPPALRRLRPDVPAGVEAVLRAALAKAARSRTPGAGRLREDLDRLLRGERPMARPPRSGRAVLAARLLAAAALVSAAWLAWASDAPEAPPVPPPAPGRPRAEALAERARGFRTADPREAARLLGEALREEPARHGWRLERGLLLWALGENREAREEWGRVCEAPGGAPESEAAHLYRALEVVFDLDLGTRRAEEALPDLEAVLALGGPRVPLARGAIAAAWGHGGGGPRGAPRAGGLGGGPPAGLRLGRHGAHAGGRPDPVPARLLGGPRRGLAARLALDDATGALEDVEAALREEPAYAEGLLNRASVRAALGDLPAALRDIESSLRIEPGSPVALANRGELRWRLGDTAGAREDLDEAIRRRPGVPNFHVVRAAALEALGRVEEAVADDGEALRLQPDYVEALAQRARARIRLGDPRGALDDCREALRIRPGYAPALEFEARARADLASQGAGR